MMYKCMYMCICVCTYVDIFTCGANGCLFRPVRWIYICKYAYVCINTYIRLWHKNVCTYAFIYLHVRIYICLPREWMLVEACEVDICIYVHVCMYLYIFTPMIHICMYVCIYYLYVCRFVCVPREWMLVEACEVDICMYVYVCTYLYICTPMIYICMYVCIYIHMYVDIYTCRANGCLLRPIMYTCIYTYMCMHTFIRKLSSLRIVLRKWLYSSFSVRKWLCIDILTQNKVYSIFFSTISITKMTI